MPIPNFTSGETLSALRLNALVDIVNKSHQNMFSMTVPFEQVEVNATNATEAYWSWMFRYDPNNPYYKLQYTWSGRTASATIYGHVNNILQWSDMAGGANGVHNRTVDLSGLGLKAGDLYEYEIWVSRAASTFLRIDYLFMTNNASYAPTIVQ